MLKLLHFADAHIDIATHGKHDPVTGLPLRVLDFLSALDTIVNTAISEKVDLVIFAGDAYKDRTPAPTFQREWGKRIMRLSDAGIPTILLVGNHDISPATGRAHTLQEFSTLAVPHIHVIDRPVFLKPADLEGLPVQVLGLPWIFRSGLMAALELSGENPDRINQEMENRITEVMKQWLDALDPELPTILTAHGSVQGAVYGNERAVMLGKDLILPGTIVKDSRLDYVALGHIHKSQDVNQGNYPPVVYPGSIERVDFGEANDDKFFVLANIIHGKTTYEFRKLNGRRFLDRNVKVEVGENLMEKVMEYFPSADQIKDAIFRLVVEYPRSMDAFLDEAEIRSRCTEAFDFHLLRRPHEEARLRLPADESITSLSPIKMLDLYWDSVSQHPADRQSLKNLAASIIDSASSGLQSEED
ncbi:MAG: exonuclease SbcCD subunit D [Anaerolineaceae bacterium]